MSKIKNSITSKLEAALSPVHLEVIDESHRHAGHAGAREEGESHFRVRIVADAFTGMSRINRHRTVNDLLVEEIAAGVHALAIEARSPEEPDPRAARVAS